MKAIICISIVFLLVGTSASFGQSGNSSKYKFTGSIVDTNQITIENWASAIKKRGKVVSIDTSNFRDALIRPLGPIGDRFINDLKQTGIDSFSLGEIENFSRKMAPFKVQSVVYYYLFSKELSSNFMDIRLDFFNPSQNTKSRYLFIVGKPTIRIDDDVVVCESTIAIYDTYKSYEIFSENQISGFTFDEKLKKNPAQSKLADSLIKCFIINGLRGYLNSSKIFRKYIENEALTDIIGKDVIKKSLQIYEKAVPDTSIIPSKHFSKNWPKATTYLTFYSQDTLKSAFFFIKREPPLKLLTFRGIGNTYSTVDTSNTGFERYKGALIFYQKFMGTWYKSVIISGNVNADNIDEAKRKFYIFCLTKNTFNEIEGDIKFDPNFDNVFVNSKEFNITKTKKGIFDTTDTKNREYLFLPKVASEQYIRDEHLKIIRAVNKIRGYVKAFATHDQYFKPYDGLSILPRDNQTLLGVSDSSYSKFIFPSGSRIKPGRIQIFFLSILREKCNGEFNILVPSKGGSFYYDENSMFISEVFMNGVIKSIPKGFKCEFDGHFSVCPDAFWEQLMKTLTPITTSAIPQESKNLFCPN